VTSSGFVRWRGWGDAHDVVRSWQVIRWTVVVVVVVMGRLGWAPAWFAHNIRVNFVRCQAERIQAAKFRRRRDLPLFGYSRVGV
jgi:hypothetical protein